MCAQLFEEDENAGKSDFLAPLADRMRPRTIDEMVGQQHIIGPGKPLRRMIERDILSSLVFYGPPGTGKSTLAAMIASRTKSSYVRINAVLSNVKELREAIRAGEANLRRGKKTILFIDEIHRFNKSQQDALLPSVEAGSVILIGSTTQNPYFYLNNALLSRVMLFPFRIVEDNDIRAFLLRAISDRDRGFGNENIKISDQALDLIVKSSLGDVRKALMYLELSFLASDAPDEKQCMVISDDAACEAVQKKGLKYDGTGDEHYDIISGFIKSVRGSDPDASVYYLALMLEAGEDPRYIARRLAILAGEDIGLAEPDALNVAASTLTIVDFVGMPEAMYALSECTLYLALCPKSNSARNAILKAAKDVADGHIMSVPNYLKDGRSSSFDSTDRAEYKYAHDYPFHVVKQDYLEKLRHYYDAGELGAEKDLKKRLEWIRQKIYGDDGSPPTGGVDEKRRAARRKFDPWFK